MSALWVLPAVAAVVAAAVAVALLRSVREAAGELQREVARAGQLGLALAELRAETTALGATVERSRRR